MLKHVVMWKLKEEAEGRSKNENAQIMKQMLEDLVGVVPQIKGLEVGLNGLYEGANYDIVLLSDFESEEDLKAYAVHPEHVKVGDFVSKIRESRIAVDYFY